MTLTLDLPPDLEQVLLQTAQEKGVSLEALALQVLTNSIGKLPHCSHLAQIVRFV